VFAWTRNNRDQNMICICPVERGTLIGQADRGIAYYRKIHAASLRLIRSQKGPMVYDKSA